MRNRRERFYRVGDQVIGSALAFPELVEEPSREPDWTFAVSRRSSRVRHAWYHHWMTPAGTRWLSMARSSPSVYVLYFPRCATFEIDVRARAIVCRAPRDVDVRRIRHRLLNQVMPLLLAGERRLTLHGSALRNTTGVTGFVGPAGAGKSTLCALLAGEAAHVVADDCIVVERGSRRFRAIPMYPGIRLNGDSARAVLGRAAPAPKTTHDGVAAFAARPSPLARLVVLSQGSSRTVTVRRVPPARALIDLVPFAFQLDITDRRRLTATFELLAGLVREVPVFRLSYPRDFTRLEELKTAARRLLG